MARIKLFALEGSEGQADPFFGDLVAFQAAEITLDNECRQQGLCYFPGWKHPKEDLNHGERLPAGDSSSAVSLHDSMCQKNLGLHAGGQHNFHSLSSM